MRTEPRLVGGRWQPPTDGRTSPVHDPADTARVVALVPAMTAAEVTELYNEAVDVAGRWRSTSALERAAVLARAADGLRLRREIIAADVVSENGKTRAEALVEIDKSADFLDFYAGVARMPTGGWLADARPHSRTSTVVEPVGVVCLITPWNDPLLTPARKLSPALAAGNAVILKPAGETPLSGLHLARAVHDAGLPAGVLGVAVGRISEIGDALLDDPRLDALSFTGSTAVGKQLRRRLGDHTVRLQTEMGRQERLRRAHRRRPTPGRVHHRSGRVRAGRTAVHGDEPRRGRASRCRRVRGGARRRGCRACGTHRPRRAGDRLSRCVAARCISRPVLVVRRPRSSSVSSATY
jgi:acyl-CoA reductase-like NAD-dependent aldehyde dehydrogenase